MIRVLLVDDHTLFREGVRALLSLASDIEVVGQAVDGQSALEQIETLSPDVVVMDLVMPGMNGFEASRRIHDQHPATKILILSMYDDEEFVNQIIKAGASGYVLKRSAGDDLLRAIREVQGGGSSLHPAVAAKLISRYIRQSEPGGPGTEDELTPREVEILTYIADGFSNQKIAETLGLSRKTVDTHRVNIMRKLNAHDVTTLVKYALRKGLIKLEP